ncbi:MAG TPA: ABC transporter substrate-binding protein [Bacillota bacterium]|nr:ABC transporter substrate-binding protein [Bacillota bacterium]
MSLKRFYVFGLFVFIAYLGACGTSGIDSNDNGSDDDKELVIAQPNDLNSLDPQDALSTSVERVMRNMHARLFMRDQDMGVVPDLVESYDNEDDVTWHFTLKEDATFHNGDDVTAEDVKFSLERVMEDDTLKEYPYFKQLKEVNVLDDHKVEIITDGPMPTIEYVLAKSGADIMPRDYVEEVGIEEYKKEPIGAGPYQFVERKIDDKIVLEKYDDYFGDEPVWDTVTIKAITENSTRVGELLSGNVDLITDVTSNEQERIESNDGTSVVQGESTRVMLLMNRMTEGYATADPKVREAIDLAIDQGAIVDSVLGGSGVPVRSRVPEGVLGSNPDLYDAYVYDPEKAKELLKEAGYEDGLDITLTSPKGQYPHDGQVAELIASMLKEVGINVELDLMEPGTFTEKYTNNENEELIMIGLADGLMDASYSLVHYTIDRAKGQTDYHNEEVDELYKKATQTLDEGERIDMYQEIQEVVAEERPHTFLYQDKTNYGVSDAIEFEPRLDETTYFDAIQPK